MISESLKVSANIEADLAYNKTIVDGVKKEMYEQYGISTFEVASSFNMNSRTTANKSTAKLNEELVNAIATEKAKPHLKEV